MSLRSAIPDVSRFGAPGPRTTVGLFATAESATQGSSPILTAHGGGSWRPIGLVGTNLWAWTHTLLRKWPDRANVVVWNRESCMSLWVRSFLRPQLCPRSRLGE